MSPRDGSGVIRKLAAGGALVLAGCASAPAGDAQGPLASGGDAGRGRETFISREGGHCVLCHAVPGVATAGNVGPTLAGIGARLDAARIRYRVVDITRVYPGAVMPAFHRTEGLVRVAAAFAGRPVLTAIQVEDIVAYLSALR